MAIIVGTEGEDYIVGGSSADSIRGEGGDDTLEGGKGNDTLTGGKGADTFVYGSGDGNDLITDYENDDMISLKSGAITSAVVSGNDYIFTIGKGNITVKGAASKYVHVIDKNGNDTWWPDLPPAQWELQKSGKKLTLTEGFVSDSLDITNTAELSNVKDTIVTIDASAVQTDLAIIANKVANRVIGSDQDDYIDGDAGKDTISGGRGNDTLIGGKGNDSLKGGAGNDVFVYSSGDGNDIIVDYTSDDIISLKSGAVSAALVKGDDYIFKVGSGRITVKGAASKYVHFVDKNGNDIWYPEVPPTPIEITNSGKKIVLTEGFTDDSLNINTETELTNVKDTIVTIDASAAQTDIAITANKRANYIIGSSQNDYIDGGAGADKILGGDGNDTLVGSAGNDTLTGGGSGDTFVYSSGDGDDVITDYETSDTIFIKSGTISSAGVSGSDYVFKVGKGTITVKGAASKYVHFVDKNGNDIWYPEVPPTPIEITNSGKKIVLTEGFTGDSLNINTATELFPIKNTIVTIDASAVQHDIAITANKKANRILGGDGNDTLIGGKGNDTLMGGEGSDVFVYSSGDGKDVITDYTSDDIISLKSGAITSAAVSGNDYIFKVGSGRITVKNAADKYVHIVDKNGNDTWYPEIPAPSFEISNSGKKLTLTQDFASDSLNVKTEAAISNYKDTIVTIDASAVQIDLALTANNQSNYIIGSSQDDYIDGGAGRDIIYGGDGNDTIIGGKGNDSLTGGDGADVFVYKSGDGNDLIVDYGSEDIISLKSGAVSSSSVKGNDYVFKVGASKITVRGGANKSITVVNSKGAEKIYNSSGNVAWFLEDDNNFSADNQLDSLVETKTYLPAQVDTSTDLVKENNFITYSDKK